MNRLELRNKEFGAIREIGVDFICSATELMKSNNVKQLKELKSFLATLSSQVEKLLNLKYVVVELNGDNNGFDIEVKKDIDSGIVYISVSGDLRGELKRRRIERTPRVSINELIKYGVEEELESLIEIADDLLSQVEELLTYWEEEIGSKDFEAVRIMLETRNTIVDIIETDLEGGYDTDIIVERVIGGLSYTPLYMYPAYIGLSETDKDVLHGIISYKGIYFKDYFNIVDTYAWHLFENGLEGIKVPKFSISEEGIVISGSKKIKFNGSKVRANNETYHNRFMNYDKKNLIVSKKEILEYVETMREEYNTDYGVIEKNVNNFILEDSIKAILRNL